MFLKREYTLRFTSDDSIQPQQIWSCELNFEQAKLLRSEVIARYLSSQVAGVIFSES